MKKVLLFLAAIGVAAGTYAYFQLNKAHLNVEDAKSDIEISATDLFKEFSGDETKANAKFLDKVIKVCGTVEGAKTEDKSTTIELNTGDDMGVVICELDDLSKQSKTEFAKGESVCFKGLCSGYATDVVVNRCVLTK